MTNETQFQAAVGQTHWRAVQQIVRGYRDAHVLITCAQLGVFRGLAGGPRSAEALAAEALADPRALRRLLDAAVSIGLLFKSEGQYTNAPLAQTCLADENSPFHLGHLARREGAFYQRWSYLTEAVRSGQRPEANIRDEGVTNWALDFELALYDIARAAGPAIAEALSLPSDRPLRLLDVGGGHGGYSMALARRYPNLQATVFELLAAAEVARQLIEREGLAERVSVREGDFQKDDLGQGYDLVLLFGVLLSETPPGKLSLLGKAFQALVPGGQLVIRDFWLDDDRTGPSQGALFSLHMLLSTEAGDLSTLNDMLAWLAEAGFDQPQQLPLPDWLGSMLLTARKPD